MQPFFINNFQNYLYLVILYRCEYPTLIKNYKNLKSINIFNSILFAGHYMIL